MQSLLSPTQIKNYLQILGVSPNGTPDLDTLNALVYAHQRHIPFSSLDVYHCEAPPSLEVDVVFDKAITEKRGGYCFELNLVFKELLLGLGYDTRSVFCRVTPPSGKRLPISHKGIIVEVDSKPYYADIGFGGLIAAGALAFEEELKQRVYGETYRMRVLDGGRWAVDRLNTPKSKNIPQDEEDSWTPVLEVLTSRVEEHDFQALNAFCARPGARFHESVVLHRRIDSGTCSLDGNTFCLRENGNKQLLTIDDEATRNEIIEKYFEIKV